MFRFDAASRETLLRWLLEADRRGDRTWIENLVAAAAAEEGNADAATLGDLATTLLSESVQPTAVPERVATAPQFDGALHLREAEGGDGWTWWATLIEAGMSANGRYYSAGVIRQALPLFQAAPVRVFDSHGDGKPDRPNRDMCGWFDKVRLSEDGTRIEGRLNILRRAGWLRDLLREKADLVGLSISALGATAPTIVEGVSTLAVSAITRILSTDIVTHAACGGRVLHPLAESAGVLVDATPAPVATADTPTQETEEMNEELKKLIESMQAQLATLTEAATAAPAAAAPDPQIAALTEAVGGLQTQLAEAQEAQRRATSVALVESRLAGQLPAVAEHVRAIVGDRIVEATELDAAIERTRALVAKTAPVRPGVGTLEVGQAPEDKMKEMIRKMIAGERGGFRSLKEAYCTWTGENPMGARGLGLRIIKDLRRAGAGWDTTLVYGQGAQLDEAVTTSSFGNAFLDSLYKTFIADLERPGALLHRKLVREVSLSDFSKHTRVRLGGYAGSLPIVGEGSPYPYLVSPTDEKVEIALQKRGGLDTITWEATLRNDADIVTRLRKKLYELAIRTEANQVWGTLTANGTIFDGKTLFHADHGNLGSAPLSATAVNAGIAAMRRQKPFGESDAMGSANAPVFLIVPPELEQAAVEIVAAAPGAATASLVQRNYSDLQVLVIDALTDTNNWYLGAADTGILLGFLDDQGPEPAIFVQDGETEGSRMTADQITFKARHVYATAVEEYRGLYGSIVP